ncbi:MAG: ABC transporter substrate-binding protein [Firmicutes bacterium]|nr:ABC transporter substrate-binding protein [Bacillota bacterium]
MVLFRGVRQLMLLSLLVLIFGAVGQAEPVIVSFWHIYGPGSPAGDLMERAVEEFNRQYAGEIVIEATVVGFWDIFDQYPVARAAGIGPDVIIFNLDGVRKEAFRGWLTDLTPLIERDGIDMDDFLPGALEAVTLDDKIYGLPFNLDTRVLFYNRALFREAGLDPDRPPQTWDDLRHTASRLTRTEADGTYSQLGFHPMWGNVWFVPWLHSNSGRWFDDEGNPIINHPRNVEALQFVVSLIQEAGQARLNEFGEAHGFDSAFQGPETLAMVIQADDFMGHLEKNHPALDFGVGLIPYNTEPASQLGGFAVYLPTGEKTEAAWTVAKYFTGAEFMTQWVSETGNLGGRLSVAWEVHRDDPKRLLATEQMVHSRFNDAQTHPEFEPWGEIFPRVDQAVNLQVTPAAALEDAQRVVEALLREVRAAN